MERGSVAEDETFPEIREAIRRLCATFPGSYRACTRTHGGFGFAKDVTTEVLGMEKTF